MNKRIVFLIVLMLIFSLAGCRAPVDEPSDADIIIAINGSNYSFSPSTIRVQFGQLVRIELTSTQGTHDWVVDEFNAATALVRAGNTRAVEFVADQAGEFEFYCSVEDHRALGMVGTLIVEE